MLRTLSLCSVALICLLISVACAPVSRRAPKHASQVELSKDKRDTKDRKGTKSTKGVEFVLLDRYEGRFKFTNHSRRTIVLNSMSMADSNPKDDPFTPAWPVV